MDEPKRVALDDPSGFLAWFASPKPPFQLDAVDVAQVWGLVGLAALARRGRVDALALDENGGRPATRFAHAAGIADALQGITTARPGAFAAGLGAAHGDLRGECRSGGAEHARAGRELRAGWLRARKIS